MGPAEEKTLGGGYDGFPEVGNRRHTFICPMIRGRRHMAGAWMFATAIAALVLVTSAGLAAPILSSPAATPGAPVAPTGPAPSEIRTVTHPGPSDGGSAGLSAGFPHGHASDGRYPHPGPVRAGANPAYAGHYYAGSVYSGVPVNSTQLSATIHVPQDAPQIADFYYVLLSVWDDAGSYDQIGFANAFGVWGFTYSATDYCGHNYFFSPDAFDLTAGTTYNFSMTLWRGSVNYTATYVSNRTLAFEYTQSTGGHVFLNDGFYPCENNSYYDLTDYEEVYFSNNTVPPYDFHFGSNVQNRTPLTGWSVFTTPPLPGNINPLISGSNTTIANEEYDILPSAPSTFVVVSSTNVVRIHSSVDLVPLIANGSVPLFAYQVPGSWSVILATRSGTPPYASTVEIDVPGSTGSGLYAVGIGAGDPAVAMNQITIWVNVISGQSVIISAFPHAYADVGQNVTFHAGVAGGDAGLTFGWAGLPNGCVTGTATTFTCTVAGPANYSVTATVHDTYGNSASSPGFAFWVYDDPIVQLVILPGQADVGQSAQFFATASGGAGNFAYRWSGLPAGCTVRTANVTCVVASPGNFSVVVHVTDRTGFTVDSTPALLQVLSGPMVAAVATTQTADVGQLVWVNATGSGGAGGYSYLWTLLPPGCSATGGSAVCSFPDAGHFTVSVEAQDSLGVFTAPIRTLFTVSPAASVRLIASPSSVDLGQATVLSATVSGGAPGYHYLFSGLPTGCSTVDSGSVSCRPTAMGTFANVSVAVTDANRFTFHDAFDLVVHPYPTITVSATPRSIQVGQSVTFTATVSGGAGGDVFTWTNLPGGCPDTTAATITCSPDGSGTYDVAVASKDLVGGNASGAVHLVVSTPSIPWTLVLVILAAGGVAAAIGILVILLRRRRRFAQESSLEAESGDAGPEND